MLTIAVIVGAILFVPGKIQLYEGGRTDGDAGLVWGVVPRAVVTHYHKAGVLKV